MTHNMKNKLLITALSLGLALAACSQAPAEIKPQIAPSEFSQETKEVLKLFEDEMFFFDFTVDETIKSSSVDVWTYGENGWESSGATHGNIEAASHRMALRVEEDSYTIYNISEGSSVKSSFDSMPDFSEIGYGSTRLSNPTDIVVGKEIPLYVKLGDDGNGLMMSLEGFRDAPCTVGFAVTVTFYDTPVSE